MQVTEHIDALERDGKRLVSVARASNLDLPVPTCPGWRLADLLAHIGFVHHWAASYVFWARRQAHETAVHRADAELARAGAVTPFEPAFAADGIDELLFGFLARRKRRGDEGAPEGSMVLEATDFAASWTVRIRAKGVTALAGDHGGDLSVRATASDLYLFAWNRRGVQGLEVSGNRDVVKRWQESARVRWA